MTETVLLDARNHFKIKNINPIPLLQRIRQMMLPSAYWLLNLFKTVSKYNTAPLRHKKNSYTDLFFKDVQKWTHLVGSNHSPHCWLHMICNWVNNSKDMNMYTHWLWSQNKCIYWRPLMLCKQSSSKCMAQIHIWQWFIYILAYPSSDWLWCTGLFTVQAYSDAFCLQQNLLHS